MAHRRKSGRKKPILCKSAQISSVLRLQSSLSDHVFVESPIPVGTDGILTTRRARLAIQQHDDIYDAIVISTLPHYPFCCHEDLVTMSRSQLLRVVDSFNSRLPLNAQIVIPESSSASYIRNCIENIVGITPPVPRDSESINQQSSRRNFREISDSFNDFRLHGMSLSPGSLLATEDSRGQELVSKSRRTLETLVEDDEDGAPKNQRTIKKQRLSLNDVEETSLGHGERRLPHSVPRRSLVR